MAEIPDRVGFMLDGVMGESETPGAIFKRLQHERLVAFLERFNRAHA